MLTPCEFEFSGGKNYLIDEFSKIEFYFNDVKKMPTRRELKKKKKESRSSDSSAKTKPEPQISVGTLCLSVRLASIPEDLWGQQFFPPLTTEVKNYGPSLPNLNILSPIAQTAAKASKREGKEETVYGQ